MTSLADRPNTAVLVIDVQNDVVANAYQRNETLANIGSVVDQARAENVPVIWVQHADDEMSEGTDGWQYVPELSRRESEPLVHKRYGDSFEATDLETELATRRIGRLVIVDAQTDACIRSTLHGAITRGYDTVLVSDAHTTDDYSEYGLPTAEKVIAHTNTYWSYQTAPQRDASVVTTASVELTTPTEGGAG